MLTHIVSALTAISTSSFAVRQYTPPPPNTLAQTSSYVANRSTLSHSCTLPRMATALGTPAAIDFTMSTVIPGTAATVVIFDTPAKEPVRSQPHATIGLMPSSATSSSATVVITDTPTEDTPRPYPDYTTEVLSPSTTTSSVASAAGPSSSASLASITTLTATLPLLLTSLATTQSAQYTSPPIGSESSTTTVLTLTSSAPAFTFEPALPSPALTSDLSVPGFDFQTALPSPTPKTWPLTSSAAHAGQITGVVIGSISCVLLVGVVAYWLYRWRKGERICGCFGGPENASIV
jgi:hypothetical protein